MSGIGSPSTVSYETVLVEISSGFTHVSAIVLAVALTSFLPPDAMRKRGLCCRPVSVCLSVRPSVTLVDYIVKLLCRPGSPIILVFWRPAPVHNSKGNPFSKGAKYQVVGKFCNFRQKSPSISETARDRPMVAMERKSYALYRMVTFSMTWTNPNPVFKDTAFLKSNISKLL